MLFAWISYGPGGIAATIAPRSGRLVLAFNNRAGGGWGGVLSLAVSEDGGATFPWVRDLEPDSAVGAGPHAYPRTRAHNLVPMPRCP